MTVVCAIDRPRSAIISTRSRKLSLKRRYHLTHNTITSRSKWRPVNSSSTARKPAILPSPTQQKAERLRISPLCTRAHQLRADADMQMTIRLVHSNDQQDPAREAYTSGITGVSHY